MCRKLKYFPQLYQVKTRICFSLFSFQIQERKQNKYFTVCRDCKSNFFAKIDENYRCTVVHKR